MKKPAQLSKNVFLIDGFDLNMPERTGTYVLLEEKITLIETSASPSVPHILEGLKTLGVSPAEITYIIVTHIHLDHAGGAGLLLEHCPQAKVVVHPKGARHLIDPSRLIQGAKAVYGEKFDALFSPIISIPEDKIIIKEDKDLLEIGASTTLKFIDTPGHSNHHFSIFHPPVKGIFTGDTAGIYYPQLSRDGIEFYLPSTSPNQFDPVKMRKSIAKFKKLGIERIYFGHYGMSENPEEAFRQVEDWLEVFLAEARAARDASSNSDGLVKEITERIFNKIIMVLGKQGMKESEPIFNLLHLDVSVSAMGLADYLQKHQEVDSE